MTDSLIRPFEMDADKVAFAQEFLGRRIWGFKKDVNICLTTSTEGNHAFMPALMTCISFLDLLSGLRVGLVDGHKMDDFLAFMREFGPRYDEWHLRILYVVIRHKLAHLGHPLFVLNTATEPKRIGGPPMLLGWKISRDAHEPPIAVYDLGGVWEVKGQPVPWAIYVTHEIHISIRTIANDAPLIAEAYFQRLRTDRHLMDNFSKCMHEFYQCF